jgi:hypothetical protein
MISMIPVKIVRKEGADIVIPVALDRNMHIYEELKTVKDIF